MAVNLAIWGIFLPLHGFARIVLTEILAGSWRPTRAMATP